MRGGGEGAAGIERGTLSSLLPLFREDRKGETSYEDEKKGTARVNSEKSGKEGGGGRSLILI